MKELSAAVNRLLRYVQVDTQSDPTTGLHPSSEKQKNLARMLAKELKDLGIEDVRLDDEHCYVYAVIPSNVDYETKSYGFIAHMDTSPDAKGADVKPRIIENYDGGIIVLNEELGIVSSPEEFPSLKTQKGKTLIVTDGTTLLGADDKAGVAAIMTMAEEIMAHPEYKHGKICIGFTPDEEVGAGVAYFDVEGFGADFAFTVDGSCMNEIAYENFNAASAKVTITGREVHPGSAKNIMLNASLLGMEYHKLLPQLEAPQYTEGYEGFYHLHDFVGNVEKAHLSYILRDHDKEKLEVKKAMMQKACEEMNACYGAGTAIAEVKDSYSNMKELILPHMDEIERAKEIMRSLGMNPAEEAIRGGTDGAALSYKGLPCPNLGNGGYEFHGKHEYLCVEELDTVAKLLEKLVVL